jgi:hypothetical protein
MKKLILLAIPAALIAGPAFAQNASGSVGVTGVVGGRCAALTPITGSFNLGELAVTAGTVDSAFSNHIDPLSKQFTIVCTSADANVAIDATPLDNSGDNTTGSGYTGRVHYTATTVFQRTAGTHTYIYGTTNAGGTLSAPLGGRLANVPNNVTLSVSNGRTDNATDLLKAGTYNGVINITISPL